MLTENFHCIGPLADLVYKLRLEGTARYAGLLLAPAEGFGLRPRLFLPFVFLLILGHFWCSVVTSVTFSSNLSNFEKNQKKSKKNSKKPKKSKKN